MPSPRFDLQALSDRTEITDVINRYAVGVAARDVDLLVSLFADDAVLDYYGRQPIEGTEAIRALFTPDPARPALPLDPHVVSTPIMTNVLIEVDGDAAHAESYCLATHAGERDGEGLVLVRGTRNVDDLRRTPVGWRITRRRHEKLWSIEVPGATGFTHQD